MNTDFFNSYLKNCLLPAIEPGSVIIMDNASFHKSSITQELIKNYGCTLLFLPPYSPELNPIEHIWALLKSHQISRLLAVCEAAKTQSDRRGKT